MSSSPNRGVVSRVNCCFSFLPWLPGSSGLHSDLLLPLLSLHHLPLLLITRPVASLSYPQIFSAQGDPRLLLDAPLPHDVDSSLRKARGWSRPDLGLEPPLP